MLQVEIKTSERNLKKSNDKIESLEAEVKEMEEFMRQSSARRQEVEKEGIEVIDKTKELKAKLAVSRFEE